MSEELSQKLERVRDHMAFHLDEMRKAFKPGHKITVLVRVPGFPERDFVMTDDTGPEVAEMVARRFERFES